MVELHSAYKRLALRNHPDRTAGDPESLAIFCRVTEAYAILREGFQWVGRSRPVKACPGCGRARELFSSLDGRPSCTECLLHGRRRLLPLPEFRTVRCIAAALLQAGAASCATAAAFTGDWRYGLAGVCMVVTALGTLAYNVLTADVIDG